VTVARVDTKSRKRREFLSAACGLAALLSVISCRPPRATPVRGEVVPEGRLPKLQLAPEPRRVRFSWEATDGNLAARGDGAARLAPPDSVRVDMFLGGGLGGRAASVVLIGDSVRTPPGALMTELIPPPPLLWATLGRLALPALPDTIIRVSGDTTRATIGNPEQWRVTAIGDRLVRVERVDHGRIVEWVDRTGEGRVRYQSTAHRSLLLEIHQDQPASPFDASIWRY